MESLRNDPFVKAARSYMQARLRSRHSLISSIDGLEHCLFSLCLDETADLIASAGYGSRVVAAGYLQFEKQKSRSRWHEAVFDPDIPNLLAWVDDDYLHMSSAAFQALLTSRLRFAPPNALILICARLIVNLRSLCGLSDDEVRDGLLDSVGWEPLPLPLEEPVHVLKLLYSLFYPKLPPRLTVEYFELVETLDGFSQLLSCLPTEENGIKREAMRPLVQTD